MARAPSRLHAEPMGLASNSYHRLRSRIHSVQPLHICLHRLRRQCGRWSCQQGMPRRLANRANEQRFGYGTHRGQVTQVDVHQFMTNATWRYFGEDEVRTIQQTIGGDHDIAKLPSSTAASSPMPSLTLGNRCARILAQATKVCSMKIIPAG